MNGPLVEAKPRMRRIGVYSGGEILGDGLFKLPFLKDLRARFSHDHLVWLARRSSVYADVLSEVAGSMLDETLSATGLGDSPFHAVAPLPEALRHRRFDVLIDTQTVITRSLAARRLSRGIFVSPAAAFLLSDRKPAAPRRRPAHFLDRLTQLLDLAAPAGATGPTFELAPAAYRVAAEGLLPEGPRYIGFAPGSGDTTKRWPLDRFLAVARDRARQGDVPVFFVGPAEMDLLPAIRTAMPAARFPELDARERAQVLPTGEPLAGPPLVIALATRLAAAVCNDSGTGHMLAAGGAPLVLLFGRHDPAKYAPRGGPLRVVWAYDYGGPDPARIPVPAVSNALDALLSEIR